MLGHVGAQRASERRPTKQAMDSLTDTSSLTARSAGTDIVPHSRQTAQGYEDKIGRRGRVRGRVGVWLRSASMESPARHGWTLDLVGWTPPQPGRSLRYLITSYQSEPDTGLPALSFLSSFNSEQLFTSVRRLNDSDRLDLEGGGKGSRLDQALRGQGFGQKHDACLVGLREQTATQRHNEPPIQISVYSLCL
jgi:hypothetical protein